MVDEREQAVADALHTFPFFPELGTFAKGKVRDSFKSDDRIVFVASDRISAFDVIMDEPIPYKGQVLNEIANFWFEKTSDIVPNHVQYSPDPNVLVAEKCTPFDVEFIIRGFITGSAWKDYEKGSRSKSGIPLPDGLRKNQQFDSPIITNTTKAKTGHDLDISRTDILERKLMTEAQLDQAEDIMRKLYARGVEVAAQRGLILVDTKYEMGLDRNGRLILLDEVHTPDSSRYWYSEGYAESFAAGKDPRDLSKEFLRTWLKAQGFTGDAGQKKPHLPIDVVTEISSRYIELFQTVTGKPFTKGQGSVEKRVRASLTQHGLLKGGYVNIIAGSEGDKEHYGKIQKALTERGVPNRVDVLSAHKQTEPLLAHLKLMNTSAEPVVYIAVAGLSNALGAVISSPANNPRDFPVINCPPFADTAAYMVDIHSSLRMPSKIPTLTVVHPENAAIAAYQILKMAGGKFGK